MSEATNQEGKEIIFHSGGPIYLSGDPPIKQRITIGEDLTLFEGDVLVLEYLNKYPGVLGAPTRVAVIRGGAAWHE